MSSGGGGGGGDTTSTSYTTNLPAYAQPYVQDLFGRASAASTQPYTAPTNPFGQPLETVAPVNATQNQALAGYQGQLAGSGALSNAATAAQGVANSNFKPSTVTGSNVNAYMTSTGNFDNAAAQQYMNPYTQNVIDAQKTNALYDYGQQNIANNSNLVSQGAFGGTRQAVINANAQRNLNTQLQGIEATGLNTAYTNAQQQFNADQGRSLSSQQGNVSANLQAQTANQSNNLQAQLANQQAQANAAQLNNNSQLQAASTLGSIGSTQNQNNLAQLQGISGIGGLQQSTQQAQDTSNYNQFLNQQNWSQNQLGWLSGILHGNTVGANTNQTSVLPSTNIASQLTGLGLTGLGAANAAGA